MIYLFAGLIIVYFSYEAYFSIGESIIMGISCVLSFRYLTSWYAGAAHTTKFFNAYKKRIVLYCLPFTAALLYLVTLRTAASYDVVDSIRYIFMYLMLGITWLFTALQGMFLFFDFSYRDDVLTGNHTAPLITCSFACLAVALIYAGANVGDGPGWWTVVFAGGLGTVTWLLLGCIVNRTTTLVEHVIMDKNVNSSIRLGSYLLASGIILARASSGDWTSFGDTVIEFLTGWPVILLTVFVILMEYLVFGNADNGESEYQLRTKSIAVSLLSLLIALTAVIRPLLAFLAALFR